MVLETGVAQGVTSRCILAALDADGLGELHSVDLPPLGTDVDDYVGCLVPDELRIRWTLHRGSSRRLLPPLLSRLSAVDVFVHDSLHTTRNIAFELEAVTPYLTDRAIVVADDIEANDAFERWVGATLPACCAVSRERDKPGQFGLAVR